MRKPRHRSIDRRVKRDPNPDAPPREYVQDAAATGAVGIDATESKRLTPAVARMVENHVIHGQSKAEAARTEGLSPTAWNSKTAREYFASLMPEPELIAQRIREGLDATRTSYVGREGIPAESVDYGERRQYAVLAANYRGLPQVERVELAGDDGGPIRMIVIDVAAKR